MDDLVEGVIGFFMVLFLIGVAIYLLILAIPFILYGLSVYYTGKRFRDQLQRYQLTRERQVGLFMVGLVCGLVSLGVVVSLGGHPLSAVLIAVPLFLVSAVSMLGIWAFYKRVPYTDRLRMLRKQERNARYEIGLTERRIAALKQENEEIERVYGDLIPEKERLDETLRELTLGDAQIWTIKIREWEEELSELDDQQLEGHRAELRSVLSSRPDRLEGDKVALKIQLTLVLGDILKRGIGVPVDTRENNDQLIEEISRRKRALEGERDKVAEEVGRAEAAYQQFLSSRILLN